MVVETRLHQASQVPTSVQLKAMGGTRPPCSLQKDRNSCLVETSPENLADI